MEEYVGVKRFGGLLRLRCPNCGKASVFYRKKYQMLRAPLMKEVCDNCGYRFHREPGFYQGAMFVSYGMALLEGILAFFLARWLVFGLSPVTLILVSIAAVLFCAMWNYRFARVLWLNIYS